jgi:UDP-N-acetylmuramoyl-tripeptide--D-alanyl-D-alanine ligase
MPSLAELTNAIDGRLVSTRSPEQATSVAIGPIVTDSRRVEPGDVFWALRGPHFNGDDFVDDAFRRGATAAVTNGVSGPADHWIVQTTDTLTALQRYSRWVRERFSGTLIGVTGSMGKTTARQMIHTVLGSRSRGTATSGNLNNRIGVPLSMLKIEPDHAYAVLELGASHRGEIAELARLCRPKIGVITHIGDAHLGGFGSRQAIAESKAELLAALPADGHAFLGDDPWLRKMAAHCRCEVTFVGQLETCHIRAEDVESRAGKLRFSVGGQGFSVPVWGRHHLTAALLAIAVGQKMGLDLGDISAALADYRVVPQRCEVVEVRGATIVNDTYNANPSSMRAALALLTEIDVPGRRIVVSGDMAELGDEAAALHWELGQQIVKVGQARMLVACGQFARCVVAGARAAGMMRGKAVPCQNVDDALPYLGQMVQPGDVVLVKGSRMMAMERVVQALQSRPQRISA